MAVKFLISGEANSGKTTVTKDLKDTLVISHDGKAYPYKTPHALVPTLDSADSLIAIIEEKAGAYQERFGDLPKTIVFDSVSRIFESLHDSCSHRYTGFGIYQNLDKEIKKFCDYVENNLVACGVNVVLISHALYDADTNKYNLVGKGSFSKIGGFLSTVDEGVFIETKNDKRTVHFRSTKFPARTLQEDFPDSVLMKDFNLSAVIDHIANNSTAVSEYAL